MLNDELHALEIKKTRADYYKRWRVEHPGDIRNAQLRYWEKKAREVFGKKYKAPAPGEELSEQARELRRKYYAERRKNNPEEGKKATAAFWDRLTKDPDGKERR